MFPGFLLRISFSLIIGDRLKTKFEFLLLLKNYIATSWNLIFFLGLLVEAFKEEEPVFSFFFFFWVVVVEVLKEKHPFFFFFFFFFLPNKIKNLVTENPAATKEAKKARIFPGSPRMLPT